MHIIKITKLIIFALFLLFKSSAFVYANNRNEEIINKLILKSKEIHLAKSEEWLALLHYINGKSVIHDKEFFISDEGYKNPELELEETIKSFFNDSKKNICKYPMRYKYIKEKLNEDLPYSKCDKLNDFIKKLSVNEVYIIFASETLSNPTSMMGHLFIKVRGTDKNGNIIANSIGYRANYNKDKDNILFFYPKAIFRGVNGYYFVYPYLEDVNKYVYNENRNLWEYKLNLTEEQIENFVLHLWEIKEINIKYNFILNNCGTAVYSILYPIEPKLINTNNFFDTPISLVKKLSKENLIKDISIIVSDDYKYQSIKNQLSRNDRIEIKNIIKYNNVENINNTKILEITKTILDVNKNRNSELEKKINSKLNSSKYTEIKYDIKNPLKKSNDSKLFIGYKNNYNKNVINFDYFPIYNDIYGNNYQYFNEFQLNMLRLQGNYFTNDNKLRIEKFDIINIKNINPSDSFSKHISNEINFNFERESINQDNNKMFFNTNFALGKSFQTSNKLFLFYFLSGVGYSNFESNKILYLYPNFGFFIHDTDFTKFNVDFKYYFSNLKYKYKYILSFNQSIFINQNLDSYIKYEIIEADKKTYSNFTIGLSLYF